MRKDEFQKLKIDPEIKKFWLEFIEGKMRRIWQAQDRVYCRKDGRTLILACHRWSSPKKSFWHPDFDFDKDLFENEFVRFLKLRAFQ